MLVELKNTSKKLCIIGDPVEHSRSPSLQNAMCRALGLEYVYLCQRVRRGDTEQWLQCAAFLGYAGFNATMPHKEALVPLMDELDPLAEKCGAVNTVRIADGKFYGYNTDGAGFLQALTQLGVSPASMRTMVLGAGGAAKAVCAVLTQQGAHVTVCNRTKERAEALCRMDPERMTAAGFSPGELRENARRCELLVNCTCLGMEGTGTQFESLDFLEALPRQAAVCDAIYAPACTRLLQAAQAAGHPVMNGTGMLLYQAVLALEKFVGEPIDRAAAKAAALEALGERSGTGRGSNPAACDSPANRR